MYTHTANYKKIKPWLMWTFGVVPFVLGFILNFVSVLLAWHSRIVKNAPLVDFLVPMVLTFGFFLFIYVLYLAYKSLSLSSIFGAFILQSSNAQHVIGSLITQNNSQWGWVIGFIFISPLILTLFALEKSKIEKTGEVNA
jgi:hypothetical protein